MAQKIEWLEEDWEKPTRRQDGGYRRKGKRTTRTYRKWSASQSKNVMLFAFGIFAAAVLNYIAAALH